MLEERPETSLVSAPVEYERRLTIAMRRLRAVSALAMDVTLEGSSGPWRPHPFAERRTCQAAPPLRMRRATPALRESSRGGPAPGKGAAQPDQSTFVSEHLLHGVSAPVNQRKRIVPSVVHQTGETSPSRTMSITILRQHSTFALGVGRHSPARGIGR